MYIAFTQLLLSLGRASAGLQLITAGGQHKAGAACAPCLFSFKAGAALSADNGHERFFAAVGVMMMFDDV